MAAHQKELGEPVYAPDGKVAAEDETHWKNGELQAYRYRRYTTGESSSVERR